MYLTYRELFTIHAICSWCVASAIIFTLLAAVTTARVVGGRPAARANGHYCGGLSARSRRAPAASGVQETAGVRKRIAPSRPAPAAVDGRQESDSARDQGEHDHARLTREERRSERGRAVGRLPGKHRDREQQA